MRRKRVAGAFAAIYLFVFVSSLFTFGSPSGPGGWAATFVMPAIYAGVLVFVPLLLIRGVIRGKDLITTQIR